MRLLIVVLAMVLSAPVISGSLNERLVNSGFKGLNKNGIAKFLYEVKHGESLATGLNMAFWSDQSDKTRKQDAMFEAAQLVDGYIIYKLFSSKGDEDIEFTIAVPSSGTDDFLTGMRLRDRCHSYTGNLKFTTGIGTDEIIPAFKPIRAAICPGK